MSEPDTTFASKGGWWVLTQGAIILAALALGPLARGRWPWPWRVVGGVLLLLMVALLVAGVAAQGRRLTPFPRPVSEARLLQKGIYGLIRHPLYACNLCFLWGWALIWASGPALLVALVALPFYQAKARREEQWLRQRFPDYLDYERRVKRFLPGLW